MKNNLAPLNERTEELLSLLVTEGLSNGEQGEFEQVDWSSFGTSADTEIARFEQAAAAFAVAFDELTVSDADSLPGDLQNRLADEAKAFFSAAEFDVKAELAAKTVQPATVPTSSLAPPSWREALAILAAAACIAMLLFNWNATPAKSTPISVAQRLAILEQANPTDLVNTNWIQHQDKNTRGRIVWSDARQEGYMVFDGLPVNNPTKEQYQLWIFDTDKNQAYPVDGGVFDISETGKTILPIDARIPVDKAVQFAVTIEKPGGVVVSDRKRLPVLAAVE